MAKKLLNEATVRRFQKLAQVTPINENWMNEEEEMEDEMGAEDAEMDMDAEAPEMGDEMEDMEGEGDMDLELTDEEAEVIIELGKKLEAAMGGEEDMGDMDMEDAGEEDMEDEVMEAMLEGINYQPSKSEVVNEVAKRVARRLAEAKKAEKRMNEALGRKK